jgi:DNA-binding winged helix-turn-helix (wHTH) protein
VNELGRDPTNSVLTTADLAARSDFILGQAVVSPSSRTMSGPGGTADVEPRVMQVLVVLADAAGHVVTRATLFERCWGGVYVGDDSLNRAIGALRRLALEIGGGSFEVETIPRTGYRLSGESLPFQPRDASKDDKKRDFSRRGMIVGGATAAALAGGAGFWWLNRSRSNPRFDILIERGENALRMAEPASKYFKEAVAVEPRNARAWGLLAYSLGSGGFDGPDEVSGPTAQAAERAARTALSINPDEPNASLAMIIFHNLDRLAREDEVRRVLTIDPDNTLALRSLASLLSGAGRSSEALGLLERITAIQPLAPPDQFRKALTLWVVGRVADADRVINRAMALWPTDRLVRLGRLMIYAFTGRYQAALTMVEEEARRPTFLSSEAVPIWRASLFALETRTPPAIAAARKVLVEGAKSTSAVAAWGILVLPALSELDAAFEVADGFLLGRGPVIVQVRRDSRTPSVHGPGWRNNYGLFTPPAKPMRLDPRFKTLADGLGLTDYWRRRGIGPDAFLFKP